MLRLRGGSRRRGKRSSLLKRRDGERGLNVARVEEEGGVAEVVSEVGEEEAAGGIEEMTFEVRTWQLARRYCVVSQRLECKDKRTVD